MTEEASFSGILSLSNGRLLRLNVETKGIVDA
jgi:hypothetical protein